MYSFRKLLFANREQTTKLKMHVLSAFMRSHVRSIVWALFLLPFISGCNKFEVFEITRVKTLEVSSITTNQFTIEGEVKTLGRFPVLDHGFIWSEDEKVIADTDPKVALGSINQIGKFSQTITGFEAGTTYFVRAYVKQGQGILVGEAKRVTMIKP